MLADLLLNGWPGAKLKVSLKAKFIIVQQPKEIKVKKS